MSSSAADPNYMYYEVGSIDDFMERVGRRVIIGAQEIALFKTSDGALYALENKSPGPKGGTLVEGMVSEHILFDPICDWRIRMTDGQVLDPDTGQVTTYPVLLSGERVHIGIPKSGGESDNDQRT